MERFDETGTAADVVIEAGFANADASTGAYEVSAPAAAARAALHGQALATADNPVSTPSPRNSARRRRRQKWM